MEIFFTTDFVVQILHLFAVLFYSVQTVGSCSLSFSLLLFIGPLCFLILQQDFLSVDSEKKITIAQKLQTICEKLLHDRRI